MTEYYKMPVTGKTTTDFEEYQMAWRALAAPIEKAFDMTLAAFDRDLCFVSNSDRDNYICIPVWFAKRFKENTNAN